MGAVLFQVTGERYVCCSMPLATDQIDSQETLRHSARLAYGTAVEPYEVGVLTTERTAVDLVALEQRGDGISQGIKIVLHGSIAPQSPRRQQAGRPARDVPRGSPDWALPF